MRLISPTLKHTIRRGNTHLDSELLLERIDQVSSAYIRVRLLMDSCRARGVLVLNDSCESTEDSVGGFEDDGSVENFSRSAGRNNILYVEVSVRRN